MVHVTVQSQEISQDFALITSAPSDEFVILVNAVLEPQSDDRN